MICRRLRAAIQCSSRVSRNSRNAALRAAHRFVTSLALSRARSISRLGVFRAFLTNTRSDHNAAPLRRNVYRARDAVLSFHAHLPQRAFEMSHMGLAELIEAVTLYQSRLSGGNGLSCRRAGHRALREPGRPAVHTIHVTYAHYCIFEKWGSLRAGCFPSACLSHRWTEADLRGVIRP